MHLTNGVPMQTGYTLGMAPDGKERLVAVIKGTYTMPQDGGVAKLAAIQEPLTTSDTFTGQPGLSATVYEADYAPEKGQCDVLLHGQAYAPNQQPVTRLPVGIRVGAFSKTFDVVGRRFWERTLLGGLKPSKPMPFLNQTISYDEAWGGVDSSEAHPEIQEMYRPNPVGKGYHPVKTAREIEGRPLPITEASNAPISSVKGPYSPMAFGPIGRSWTPRSPLAGTYDQHWQDHVFPFLPADFNPAYYQAAPPDQQIPFLKGGEEVVLMNLTPEGKTTFTLPDLQMPVEFCDKSQNRETVQAQADTLILEPEARRLIIVWRASKALENNIFEMKQIVIGRMPDGWYRAREKGKKWYPSLSSVQKDAG